MNTHDLYSLLTSSPTLALLALAIERWVPWPEQWHPIPLLRLFAQYLQSKVNQPHYSLQQQRFAGILAVLLLALLCLLPTAIVVYAADFSQLLGAVVLLSCLRRQHFIKMINRVEALALKQQKRAARALLAQLDYRDSHELSVHGLLKTTAELRLMSLVNHRWGPILAWLLGGPILALAIRLIVELHSLWPISVPRYRAFGLAARTAYLFLLGPVLLLLSLPASFMARLAGRRPAAVIKNSRAWAWPTAKWLDSFSRWHQFALGGPIKIQGQRLERQRFSGRAPESHHAQLIRSCTSWDWWLTLLLVCSTLLLFIYRP